MKNKKIRLNTIIEIISSTKIKNQEDLIKRLEEKGFKLTQATLSRDLKELKVYKTPAENNEYTYAIPVIKAPIQHSKTGITKGDVTIEYSGNIAVLKTRPGNASSIAYDIDVNGTDEILGTIAGDDTIFVVMREGTSKEALFHALSHFIPNLKKV